MRDGMYVVGQFLGAEPIERRDGSLTGKVNISVRSRRDTFEGECWATSLDRETGERGPSELVQAIDALGLQFGERVELRVGVEVNEHKGRTYVNWNVYGIARADEAAAAPLLRVVEGDARATGTDGAEPF